MHSCRLIIAIVSPHYTGKVNLVGLLRATQRYVQSLPPVDGDHDLAAEPIACPMACHTAKVDGQHGAPNWTEYWRMTDRLQFPIITFIQIACCQIAPAAL
jgi:hypothetical protein